MARSTRNHSNIDTLTGADVNVSATTACVIEAGTDIVANINGVDKLSINQFGTDSHLRFRAFNDIILSGRFLTSSGRSIGAPGIYLSGSSANGSATERRKIVFDPSTARTDNDSFQSNGAIYDSTGQANPSTIGFSSQRTYGGFMMTTSATEMFVFPLRGSDIPGWSVEKVYISLGLSSNNSTTSVEDIHVASRGLNTLNTTSATLTEHFYSGTSNSGCNVLNTLTVPYIGGNEDYMVITMPCVSTTQNYMGGYAIIKRSV